jgi:hypothetical protein
MPAPIDLTGHKYGRITVVQENQPTTYPRKWVCSCECGTTKIILGSSLRSGLTQSCGCLNKEILSAKGTVHGDHGSRLYSIWHNMKQRCENPSNDGYRYYGSLGVEVCADWKDYNTFMTWANSSGYSPTLTLDRIDGSKNYCPSNCRWETETIQARNQKKRGTNTSGYTGVSYIPRLKKYQSYLTVAYKKVSLGYFINAKEAYEARQEYININQLKGFPL